MPATKKPNLDHVQELEHQRWATSPFEHIDQSLISLVSTKKEDQLTKIPQQYEGIKAGYKEPLL